MASTIKVTNIDTPDGTGSITIDRPTVLQAGDIITADLADDAVTLLKMEGGTDGQIITYDAAGDPVRVGPGTDGQILTSTGAGSPPAFEDAAGGGLTATIATMTGDASDTTLALGATPTGEANVTVHIDGVYQNHDQFSVSGAVLTFTVAPPTGSLVESQTWA